MSALPRHPADVPLPPPPRREQDPRHLCPLCGYRFAVGREVCGRCGLGGGCEALGCPHCGYQFPIQSTILTWLRRLGHRLGRHGFRRDSGGQEER
ncbi:MAG: hypothetical protein ACE5ID_06135 [Acidobacteriota bacterium]